jgi:hypothetical protein
MAFVDLQQHLQYVDIVSVRTKLHGLSDWSCILQCAAHLQAIATGMPHVYAVCMLISVIVTCQPSFES